MQDDELKKYTEANRASWNEVTPIHQKHRQINLKEEFAKPGYSTLDHIITGKLSELGLAGKDVAQLCCNNGRETLSMINLGAKAGVGFDISDEAIAEAKELAEISGLNCKFIRTDVFEIADDYNDRFDLILITIGALYWLPDLPRFFGVAKRILREGGKLVIYEEHPFSNMLAMTDEAEFNEGDPYKIVYTYFKNEPWVCADGIDYIGGTTYDGKVNYGWAHKISDIINGVIGGGLKIEEFIEYAHDISDEFEHLKGNETVPLAYTLIASK